MGRREGTGMESYRRAADLILDCGKYFLHDGTFKKK